MKRGGLFLFFVAFCSTAFAEGRCPPGMYPIHAIGVAACAPIPGASTAPLSQPPAPPPSREIPGWGAIAINYSTGRAGASTRQISEFAARELALAQCEQKGCEIALAYANQCGALAWGNGYASVDVGSTEALAAANVARGCSGANGGVECKVFYVDCSTPVKLF
jgi:hypothetical protein